MADSALPALPPVRELAVADAAALDALLAGEETPFILRGLVSDWPLVRAARLDGAGFFTIFGRILLPMSVPIIMVCLIWQFTQIWNDFLFGVVFASGDTQPVTVALNNLVNTSTGAKQYNVDMAAAMIAGLPTLVVYVIAGKYFLRGLTAGAVKG